MSQEDKYRQYAEEFLKRIDEARVFFANHKPSIGYAGEHLLRQSLRSLIPQYYGICQGFVIYKNEVSCQCDVIIYKKGRSAIKKTYGSLKVVHAESVISVIEVKSSVSKKTFLSTLKAFEKLEELRVPNCFLFIYNKLSRKKIENWLFEYKSTPNCTEDYYVTDSDLFDWPDKKWLPNAILTLAANKLYNISHICAYDGDWIGYAALKIKDRKNMQISCLQELFESILGLVNGKSLHIDINKYSMEDGIKLFRF